MSGGDGNDVYQFNADTDFGNDQLLEDPHYILVGGVPYNTSVDYLDFSETQNTGVVVNLGSTVVQTVTSRLTIWLRSSGGGVPPFDGVIGGAKNDVLYGNDLANALVGGRGDDRLVDAGTGPTASIEYLSGEEGDDTYEFHDVATFHHVWVIESVGTGGTDTVDFRALSGAVNIDLSKGVPQAVASGGNLILEFPGCHTVENVLGTAFSDTIRGNSTNNKLVGGGGSDTLSGARGDDVLEGGPGNDQLAGGWGDDRYVYSGLVALGADRITELAGQGTDVIDLTGLPGTSTTLNLKLALVPQTLRVGSSVTLAVGGTVDQVAYPATPVPPVAPAPASDLLAAALDAGFRAPYLASFTPPPLPSLAPPGVMMEEPPLDSALSPPRTFAWSATLARPALGLLAGLTRA
jgi:hypothetical protein